RHGFAYQTFADDDVVVESSWRHTVRAGRDGGDYDIAYPPNRIAPPFENGSLWTRTTWRRLDKETIFTEPRFARQWCQGTTDHIRIATGSGLGKVGFFRSSGLRFDTDLKLAGGEDWRLWEEAKALGAKTSWTPYAVAYETMPPSKLRLRYCYRRDRDHARVDAKARMERQWSRAILRLPGAVLSRGYKFLLAVGSTPITGGYGLVQAAFLAGRTVGLIQGTFGMTSHHYGTTHGD